MDFSLTDEQQDFVAAIRDFCERECGTQEQREKLTEGYEIHHNFDLYKQMAELGWLGVTIPEEYGGSGGSMLDACLFMEETSRGLAPIGGYATTLIVAGATQRFGTEEQKAGDPRRHRRRRGRGDRDDRARGGLRRRLADHLGRARRRRLRHQRPEGLHLQRPHLRPRARRLPHHQGRVQARGPDDDLGPARGRGHGDRPDRDDGRPRDQHALPQRLRGPDRAPSSARSTRAGPS